MTASVSPPSDIPQHISPHVTPINPEDGYLTSIMGIAASSEMQLLLPMPYVMWNKLRSLFH